MRAQKLGGQPRSLISQHAHRAPAGVEVRKRLRARSGGARAELRVWGARWVRGAVVR
jgi:hypothetical protein